MKQRIFNDRFTVAATTLLAATVRTDVMGKKIRELGQLFTVFFCSLGLTFFIIAIRHIVCLFFTTVTPPGVLFLLSSLAVLLVSRDIITFPAFASNFAMFS